MRLFHTPGSPFARIARVALRETALLARVEEVETTLRDPASSLLPVSPVGRVPTLLLPEGTALTETALIIPFLDALGRALGHGERRHRAWAWREGRPALAAWFDRITARPSFLATIPPVSGLQTMIRSHMAVVRSRDSRFSMLPPPSDHALTGGI